MKALVEKIGGAFVAILGAIYSLTLSLIIANTVKGYEHQEKIALIRSAQQSRYDFLSYQIQELKEDLEQQNRKVEKNEIRK